MELTVIKKRRKTRPSPRLSQPSEYAPRLTVLSFGGGQDSTAILYMLAFNQIFRKLWAPKDLIVVMSDTGNEHPETYRHIRSVSEFCRDQGIDFVFITKDMGFHNGNWQSLTEYFERYDCIMSAAYPKTCTDNLKIQPFYRYLNRYVHLRYGTNEYGGKWSGKRALVEFAESEGPIRVLLGIAKGEESRVSPEVGGAQVWMRKSIMKAYPLIWLGWDRKGCQDYIRDKGMIVPPPSNCMFCPFMDDAELLWLATKYPEDFDEWASHERRKLAKFKHKGSDNFGALHRSKTLPEVLANARKKYAGWTLERLEEHRFSHGHCVGSSY